MAKKFKKSRARRSLRYKGKFNKRSRGGYSKRSILSGTMRRVIELNVPVYLRSITATLHTGSSGYAARYTLNSTTITGGYQLNLTNALGTTASTALDYAPEFNRLAKVYSHYRVSGISMKYNRCIRDSQQIVVSNVVGGTLAMATGPLAMYPSFIANPASNTDDLVRLTQNYMYDGALRVEAGASRTKSRYWKYPQRPISDNSSTMTNVWTPCGKLPNVFLNIGDPPTGVGANAPVHSVLSRSSLDNPAGSLLIGNITVKFYMQFALPQTVNEQVIIT